MSIPSDTRPGLHDLEAQLAHLRRQRERDQRALDVLYHVSMACRGLTSAHAIFEVLSAELRAVFHLDSSYIALCDLQRPDTFRTAVLYDEGLIDHVEDAPFGPFTGRVVREQIPLLIPDMDVVRSTLRQYQTTFGNTQKLSRTWMGVPLLLGPDVLGVISLQSYTPFAFNEADLDLLQRIGQMIGVALENVNLLQQQSKLRDALELRVAARTEELAALSAIAAETVLQQPLATLLTRALVLILPLLAVQAGNVRLYDRERDVLTLLAQQGIPADDPRAVPEIPVSSTRLGSIVRNNQPLVIERDLALFALNSTPSQFESLLGVPLRIGDQVLGSMVLLDTKARTFDFQQVDLAQLVANQLAIAVENARLLEQRDRQIRELRALGAISHTANNSLNLQMLLQHVYTALHGLMSLDVFVMNIYDAKREVFIEGLGIDEGETYQYYRSNEPLAEKSFSTWVIRNRRMLHLHHVDAEIGDYPDLEPVVVGSGRPAASWLGVPLFDRDEQVIGMIVVQSYTPNAFADHDERFLQNVAQQTALHIQNVALLIQRERQIRELDAIGRIGQLVSATFDLEEILDAVYKTLSAVTGAPIFYLLICEPKTHIVTNAVFIEEGHRNDLGWVGGSPKPGSMTDWIISNAAPLVYDDLFEYLQRTAAPTIQPRRFGQERHARSWAGVPLLAKEGEAIGVLSVQHFEPGLYDSQTLDFLNQVASHISLGVQKIRLFQERERQILELDAIGRIGRLVSASFDLESMLQIVYEILQQVTGAAAFYMVVLDPETHVITRAFYLERGVRLNDDWPGTVPPPDSLTGWIVRERRPLLFADLMTERERLIELGIAPVFWNNTVQPHAWIGVPLMEESALMGVLSVQDDTPNRYDEQTVAFLSQVASHLSLGVQKVLLFQERDRRSSENARLAAEAEAHAAAAERQAQRMALIQRVSLMLNSRINAQEILDLAVEELATLFGVEHTGIMLFDHEDLSATIVAEYPHTVEKNLRVEGGAAYTIEMLGSSRRPIVIPSVANSAIPDTVRNLLIQTGIITLMIAPLVSRDRIIGSIGLDSIGKPRVFSEDEQDSLTTIAATIAAAFENARLFAAEHAARHTADMLREVAQVLSSTFNANEVLNLILDQLRTVVPYDSASIVLADGDRLHAVAQRGLDDDALPTRQTFTLQGRSGAGMVVRQREPILIDDTRNSPDWQTNRFGTLIRSWLGVPLMAKGKVLGVLNIDSYQPHHFTQRDIEVAVSFASHAAVALENAQLYQDSVTRVERELEIARQIQSNLFPRELPHIPGVILAARAVPARETGGDFYDIVPLRDGRFGLMIGDASGKSIPGALLMAVARSTARSEARDHELPETVMRETNRLIAQDVPPRSFVALSYATFDPQQRILALANAGQLSPLRRRFDGTVDYLDVPGPALPLGIQGETEYAALEVALEPGDLIVFYTDGIVEAHNTHRELFGFERLEAMVSELGDLAPEDLIDTLLTAVDVFSHGTPQHDDMTLLVLQVILDA